ncbi:MAG: hypothetical protein CM15mP124_7590 [Alphaproteobacteria bacterium]|nr:MAG: hypothetical protein CM15mP124_7590 [Alphaproteobacteria bacterium]
MKVLYLYILLIILSLEINAGAPAPSTSLPEPPYVFKKGTLITAEVDWNKDSIKKFVSNDIKLDEVVNGGIEVFFTKHEKPLAKINYVLIWLNLQNDHKKLVLGFVGPDYDSNRIIEKISEKKLTLAKSRLMIINEKVSLRTNINNKLSFNISGNINANCKNNENKLNKIEISKSKTFSITHKSDSVCNLDSTNIIFTENYSDIKVNKILNASIFKSAKVTFSY